MEVSFIGSNLTRIVFLFPEIIRNKVDFAGTIFTLPIQRGPVIELKGQTFEEVFLETLP